MTEPMMIGIDPHKESWTAVVVDGRGIKIASLRVPVSTSGYRKLRQFAAKHGDPAWAIEGAYGLGAPLAGLLADDEIQVWDVPAKLAARVRVLSTGHGRKSDEDDALSVAIVAATSTQLRLVQPQTVASELKVLTEYRDDLVRLRTQTVNRLHAIMNHLILAGAPRKLNPDRAATLLRQVHPTDALGASRRIIAVDLITEVRRLDKRIGAITGRISTRVEDVGSTLTTVTGVGALTAGRIMARTGNIERFPSDNHFAAYAGAAPREVSSGDVVRHRLSRGGDRQLNYALHVIAITQIAMKTSPGRVFYDRKRAEGKTKKEALRALKRRLATVVYRIMIADAKRRAAGPAGQSGTAPKSSVTDSHPHIGSSEKSLTRPAINQPNHTAA